MQAEVGFCAGLLHLLKFFLVVVSNSNWGYCKVDLVKIVDAGGTYGDCMAAVEDSANIVVNMIIS